MEECDQPHAPSEKDPAVQTEWKYFKNIWKQYNSNIYYGVFIKYI
jgi:hypothetical protein